MLSFSERCGVSSEYKSNSLTIQPLGPLAGKGAEDKVHNKAAMTWLNFDICVCHDMKICHDMRFISEIVIYHCMKKVLSIWYVTSTCDLSQLGIYIGLLAKSSYILCHAASCVFG